VLRAVVLAQYRRVTDTQTDRQTDGIATASAALAMRALRRAVKTGRASNDVYLFGTKSRRARPAQLATVREETGSFV